MGTAIQLELLKTYVYELGHLSSLLLQTISDSVKFPLNYISTGGLIRNTQDPPKCKTNWTSCSGLPLTSNPVVGSCQWHFSEHLVDKVFLCLGTSLWASWTKADPFLIFIFLKPLFSAPHANFVGMNSQSNLSGEKNASFPTKHRECTLTSLKVCVSLIFIIQSFFYALDSLVTRGMRSQFIPPWHLAWRVWRNLTDPYWGFYSQWSWQGLMTLCPWIIFIC